jgi:hypothetical protein
MFGGTGIINGRDVIKDVMEQSQQIILDQLGDLVKKGLLVVHSDGPMLAREIDPGSASYKFKLMGAVRLELKDQGYIQKLEQENKEMRELLEKMQALVGK